MVEGWDEADAEDLRYAMDVGCLVVLARLGLGGAVGWRL